MRGKGSALGAPGAGALLGLGDGDLALLSRDGEYERIPAEAFVRAERSAVRLSLRQRERCTHAAD